MEKSYCYLSVFEKNTTKVIINHRLPECSFPFRQALVQDFYSSLDRLIKELENLLVYLICSEK